MKKDRIIATLMTQDRVSRGASFRHVWVAGTPGSGYESLQRYLEGEFKRSGSCYSSQNLPGFRGSSGHPDQWIIDMNVLHWYLHENHKPPTAFFGVGDNFASAALLDWHQIIFLKPTYEQLFDRVKSYATKLGLPESSEVIESKTSALYSFGLRIEMTISHVMNSIVRRPERFKVINGTIEQEAVEIAAALDDVVECYLEPALELDSKGYPALSADRRITNTAAGSYWDRKSEESKNKV